MVLPQTTNRVPVDSIILILKITKELNQQFNTYNLYGLSSFLNSLVARHHTCYSIVALSAAHQKHTKNRRLIHASTMLGVPLRYDDDRRQSAETDCPEERSPLVSDSSASFFNTLQVKRLPEPGFSLRGQDNVRMDSRHKSHLSFLEIIVLKKRGLKIDRFCTKIVLMIH